MKHTNKNDRKDANVKPYSIGSVRSEDGTTIGYRQLGRGPGVILIHGGMQAAQNLMSLAEDLSDTFTVYVPDRRGRGLSGPYSEHHSIKKECEDIGALLSQTNTHNLFGLSAGALMSLEAARLFPDIHMLAIYEPPLPVEGTDPTAWLPRFDQDIAQGKLGAAMITAALGTERRPCYMSDELNSQELVI